MSDPLRKALAAWIAAGFTDETIDSALYETDAVYHAVVYSLRRFARPATTASPNVRAMLEAPPNLIADRLAIEGRGPLTGDEANRATVACDRCRHCLELGCNGHEVESDAELDAIAENLKTAKRDGLPTDALEARYRVLTSGTVTVERRP